MKKGKKLKRWGSLVLAFATVLSGITVSAPLTASVDEFTDVRWELCVNSRSRAMPKTR